jgi:hypothetical protein
MYNTIPHPPCRLTTSASWRSARRSPSCLTPATTKSPTSGSVG